MLLFLARMSTGNEGTEAIFALLFLCGIIGGLCWLVWQFAPEDNFPGHRVSKTRSQKAAPIPQTDSEMGRKFPFIIEIDE